MEQNNERFLFSLNIDAQSKNFLSECAKWGKFLAILGIIFCILIALAGITVSSQYNELGNAFKTNNNTNLFGQLGPAIMIIYLAIAIIYFFPCLYLLRFSNHMKSAIATDDQAGLTRAFRNLKSMFKFLGIFTISIIVIYILAIIVIAAASPM